jgi:hypothetical protein
MARGKVFCQDGIALYEDAGSDWKSLGDIRLLAASADGRKWLVYRPGEGVMLRTYKR